MSKPITLYSAVLCPWAARSWLALEEAGLKYEYVEINLQSKPEWYLKEINPVGKVPSLKYGDRVLIESGVITEFIGDIAPKGILWPSDPFVKAQSLLFSDKFQEFFTPVYRALNFTPDFDFVEKEFFNSLDKVLPFLILDLSKGSFFGGASIPTIGDLLVAPFIARIYLAYDSGIYPEKINKLFIKLKEDPKYEQYNKWVKDLLARDSLKKTFYENKKPNLDFIKLRYKVSGLTIE